MDKAPDAYRTISEVGEDLDIAQHVLRFWETRFPQIKPLKRGGGRRYYRPDDVELLKGIRHLLYREGYTIKGVQRILKEQGAKAVQAVGRAGGLVPGLGPASPDDLAEDFMLPPAAFEPAPAPTPASPAPPSPMPFAINPPVAAMPAAPVPPPPVPPAPVAPAPAPVAAPPLPYAGFAPPAGPRMDEAQVSFTRGGIGARPTFAPVDEPPAAAASLSGSALPPAGPAMRKALLDALNELESARAAIGMVLANRDRLGTD